MTDMIQAPTPGPLWMMHVIGPDDIYPAPDHATAVEWCAALNASMPASDVLCVAVPAVWTATPEAHAEGLSEAVEGWTSPRQRLAPTAPVEASGSEREIDLYDDKVQEGIAWTMRQWGEALGLTTWTQGDGSASVEGDVGAEIHTILIDAGLRDPETNEMAALTPARAEALDEGAGLLKRLRRLEHSGDEGFDHVGPDDSRATLDSLIAAARDLSPSAPALNEGAAGEREAIIEAVKVAMKDAWEDHASDTGCWPADIKRVSDRGPLRLMFVPAIWAQTTAEWAAETILRNRARPSPTPAADADRVQEAVDQTPSSAWIDCVQKMLERFDRAKGKGGYPTANEREAMRRCMIPVHLLAALKSTAAKEGGEV